MVTTGSKHALASGNMTLNWRECKRRPANEHTWANWKLHWTAAFAKMHEISRMTTCDTTFGANQAAEIKQAQQMASSLDNLDNASIQKNATIDNLVATNAALSKAIQDIQCTLATMMTTHTPAPGAPALALPGQPTRETSPARPSHWATVKPAWDRTGYCWSHNFKVKIGHNSCTCTSCMGGSTFNAGWPTVGLPTSGSAGSPPDELAAIQALRTLLLGKVPPTAPTPPPVTAPRPIIDDEEPAVIWNPDKVQQPARNTGNKSPTSAPPR